MGCNLPSLLLVLGIALSAWGDTKTAATPTAPTAETLLRSVKGGTLEERIERFSEKLLGAPYADQPLGEGPSGRYDQGPLYRFDAFDCTTFVETVAALALSRTPREFERWMLRIRYRGGSSTFLDRNHFPCGDWIPNNTALGILVDITTEVAGPLGTIEARADESRKGWVEKLPLSTLRLPGLSEAELSQRFDELKAEARGVPDTKASLRYIPLDKILTRKPVPEDERKRREAEEKAWADGKRQAAGSLPEAQRAKLEEEIRHGIHDMRLNHLIREVDVDPGLLAAVPSAALVNIVRPNHSVPGTRLLISHQGFVIRKNGKPYFRHVSRSGGGRAKDVPFDNYLRLCLLNRAIHGIQVLKFQAPPRATRDRAPRAPMK